MSVRKVPLSDLPMEVLLIFMKQNEKDERFTADVLQEIKQRYKTYPTYRLCLLEEKLENEKLKKVCVDVLYEQLQDCDDFLEIHSLIGSLYQMSLEQLCHLSMQNNNELVRYCALDEIDSRIPNIEENQEEQKYYQKMKRRKENAKCKRR